MKLRSLSRSPPVMFAGDDRGARNCSSMVVDLTARLVLVFLAMSLLVLMMVLAMTVMMAMALVVSVVTVAVTLTSMMILVMVQRRPAHRRRWADSNRWPGRWPRPSPLRSSFV